jgi:hypothetical protein
MPVNYDIPNAYDYVAPCTYCGGTGYQYHGNIGYRACQYCITGYKVRQCICRGSGCSSCMGKLHTFNSDIMSGAHISPPDTTSRPFAGEAPIQPSRIIPRR